LNEILAFVIEDNEMLRTLYVQAIQEAGFQVESLSDGQAALDRLGVVTPNLIMVDLFLPQVSGEKVLAYVRENARFKFTRVIVASADGAWANFLSEKADFVLNKPVSYKQLRTLALRLYPTFTEESAGNRG
jgi:DNA-binding response OmpR family regulator